MMYEKLENCPSCKSTQFKNYIICKDHSVTQESFALVKCTNCSLIFTNPRPDDLSLGSYYQSDAYISHTDKANSLINFLYKIVRGFALKKKRKLIERHHLNGTILDFGCGTGDFLAELAKNNWNIAGIEIDENARRIAAAKTKMNISSSIEHTNTFGPFDVITAWHVIEHVSELRKTIKALTKKLSSKGTLFIAVPNPNSYDASYYKENWAAYDVPRHLYHFTQKSFGSLAKELKLKIVDTIPMKFDSFYVSMLSEKYKGKRSTLIPGIITGLKSNAKGSKSSEYSSLIYVLKKSN